MKHMNTTVPRNCGVLYVAFGLALLFACPAFAYTGEELAKGAKVSIAEPHAIALKAHPGKVTDEELEREAGGTGLRYSFDFKRGSSTYEVGVDARTGRILENVKEGKNHDQSIDCDPRTNGATKAETARPPSAGALEPSER